MKRLEICEKTPGSAEEPDFAFLEAEAKTSFTKVVTPFVDADGAMGKTSSTTASTSPPH
jgi:hypothetical protein